MRYRVLSVGTDISHLASRQALLASSGYDSEIATMQDFDEKLHSASFDLVIISAMLSPEDKRNIQAKLPADTRSLVLTKLVWPAELLQLVAEALK
jgi:DNA-binding response OmpR family regulator